MAAHLAHCVQCLVAGDGRLRDGLVGEVAVPVGDLGEARVCVPRIVDLQCRSLVKRDLALQGR